MKRVLLGAAITLASLHGSIQAQSIGYTSLTMLGSDTEERLRLGQLTGASGSSGFLIRSPSTLTRFAPPFPGDSAWRFGIVMPDVNLVHNSGIPFSLNDGPLWAGRGWSSAVTAGAFAQYGPARLIIAPTILAEQNEAFQVIPFSQSKGAPRSQWANPFHPLPESIDLPLRFGDNSQDRVDAGQSSLTIDAGRVSFGVATENLWWGPGIRNAIVLSNNAPGFPHAFVQTRGPLSTSAGTFDAQVVLGSLSESDFFDHDSTNNSRSLSGLVVTWSPPGDSGLSIGVSRVVMAERTNVPLGAAFDVFRTVGHADADTTALIHGRGMDQIFSMFGRWVFPGAGFEAYAEWARFEEPISFRDLLEYPGHSEGYTLGFQWARPFTAGRAFRLQGEATYLEPDPSLRVRNVATSYTSRGVPQGFTQRGQVLGAAIGPGSSSQWLAGDFFTARWRLGAYLDRIRWDNGVLFEPIVPVFKRQDVTLSAGLRGGLSWQGVDLLVDFQHAARFNYLFQSYILGPFKFGGIDLINNTLSVALSAPLSRR